MSAAAESAATKSWAEWATELRDLCLAWEGVGFHFKQHAAFRPGQGHTLCGELWNEAPLVQIAIPAD